MIKHVPLVCVGGLGVHTCDWEQFRQIFSQTQPQRPFFVVERLAFDNGSSVSNRAYSDSWDTELSHLHKHIARIVDTHGSVQLLGHSMGGLLAEGFTRLYPEMVKHLILLDSASPERFSTVTYKGAPNIEKDSFLDTALRSRVVCKTFPALFSAFALARGNTLTQASTLHDIYSSKNTVSHFFTEFQQEKFWAARLAEISACHSLSVPFLILAAPGNFTSWLPSQKSWINAQRKLAEKLLNETNSLHNISNNQASVFHVIPHATHMVMLSQPAALNTFTHL